MILNSSDDKPLVSIVTPTFPGREAELRRCIRSVLELDWPDLQHVIVSDRVNDPNDFYQTWDDVYEEMLDADDDGRLCAAMRIGARTSTLVEINETWRNETTNRSTGSYPWMIGSRLAMGEFVGFLGDDDELLPHHVMRHVEAMRKYEAMFSISKVQFRVGGVDQFVIGDPGMNLGGLDSTGIMCHVDALRHGIWDANGVNAGDWQMVRAWIDAGLRGTFVDEITGVHNDGWAAGKSGRPDIPE